jgi:hypothetical protein
MEQLMRKVRDVDGALVEVILVVPHPPQLRHLVTISTPTTLQTFTASHRIVTCDGNGVVLANDLKKDQWVLDGGKQIKVLNVTKEWVITETFEVSFENDAAASSDSDDEAPKGKGKGWKGKWEARSDSDDEASKGKGKGRKGKPPKGKGKGASKGKGKGRVYQT